MTGPNSNHVVPFLTPSFGERKKERKKNPFRLASRASSQNWGGGGGARGRKTASLPELRFGLESLRYLNSDRFGLLKNDLHFATV